MPGVCRLRNADSSRLHLLCKRLEAESTSSPVSFTSLGSSTFDINQVRKNTDSSDKSQHGKSPLKTSQPWKNPKSNAQQAPETSGPLRPKGYSARLT